MPGNCACLNRFTCLAGECLCAFPFYGEHCEYRLGGLPWLLLRGRAWLLLGSFLLGVIATGLLLRRRAPAVHVTDAECASILDTSELWRG